MKIKINGKMVECRKLKASELIKPTDWADDCDGGFYQLLGMYKVDVKAEGYAPIYRPIKPHKPKNPKIKPWGSFKIKPKRVEGKVKSVKAWVYEGLFKEKVSLQALGCVALKKPNNPHYIEVTITLRAPRTKKEKMK